MVEFIKRHIYIILGIVCIVVMGALFLLNSDRPAARKGGEVLGLHTPDLTQPQTEEAAYVVIHILGEVREPGVYTLPANARVADAVEMAGGYTQEADLTRINLAVPLRDAMQIIVPATGDYSIVGPGESGIVEDSVTASDGLIDLNTAALAQLQTLPGIGPARAQSIIDYRENIGRFTQIEELMNISGIGNAVFNGLKELITVR
ncbi:MAG: helix-hairpin-helix domain-containing protein [Defluviitaleaceae bacterium]|nr:helix-hairpin-helix domain-containing protein [Defluviitaleaceae bacterium]